MKTPAEIAIQFLEEAKLPADEIITAIENGWLNDCRDAHFNEFYHDCGFDPETVMKARVEIMRRLPRELCVVRERN